jgi:short chain dehydrogenase
VTGGSRGIGAAIVQRLATDGAQVAFAYAASAGPADQLRSDVSSHGGTAVAIKADSADAQQVTAAVDETVLQLGGLDILVNNAGVATSGTVESFSPDQFDRMVDQCSRGVRGDPASDTPFGRERPNHRDRQHLCRPCPAPRQRGLRDDEGCGRWIDPRAGPRTRAVRDHR